MRHAGKSASICGADKAAPQIVMQSVRERPARVKISSKLRRLRIFFAGI
jgi:hypothetical protein